MRILFVTPAPPHPTEGGAAIRNWHLIEAAKGAGHAVAVFSADTGKHGAVQGRNEFDRVRDLFLSPKPDLAQRFAHVPLTIGVAKCLQHAQQAGQPFDLIQVEGLEMWGRVPREQTEWLNIAARDGNGLASWLANDLRNTTPVLPPIIYDAHNAETILQRRTALAAAKTGNAVGAAYSAVQWAKLRAYERDAVRAATVTLALSREDATALSRLAGRPVDVVPVGVDTVHFALEAPDLPPPIPFDVVFSGTLDYRPNADAARWLVTEIWPFLRSIRPDATLAVVGKHPLPELRAHHGRNGITVTGSVPDDRAYMAGAKVYVLPLRFGAGVRLKLLNAMSMGRAIVATPVAAEGIEVMHGRDLLIAPTRTDSFAATIFMLLEEDDARPRFGEAARHLMVTRHDWRHATPALLDVYERIAHAPHRHHHRVH